MIKDYYVPLRNLRSFPSETTLAYIPKRDIEKRSEKALIYAFICNRQLFGRTYEKILPFYFNRMPKDSGVVIYTMVCSKILGWHRKPGDIDLLVIPYEGSQLALHKSLAIEVKISRNRFDRQHKSPNQFGYSQTQGLEKMGFPYTALIHLIVSDVSPEEEWINMQMMQIADNHDMCKFISNTKQDLMPYNLLQRSYRRLLKNRPKESSMGLVCAYLDLIFLETKNERLFFPVGDAAHPNSNYSISLLKELAQFANIERNLHYSIPRYDP